MKDLNTVNGFAVITRQKARWPENATQFGGKYAGREIGTVDEVLLENEQTIFQCVHKAALDCEYTADNAISVTAHQRSHGSRATANRAARELKEKDKELAATKAELNNRIQRRSAGSKKGWATKRASHVSTPVEVGGRSGEHNNGNVVGNADLAKAGQRVITAFNAMQDCADEFQKVLIGYLRLAQTLSETPAIDPQILAKAQQYDAMKAAMKALNDL